MAAGYLITDYLYLAEHFNRTEYPVFFGRYCKELQSYMQDHQPVNIADTAREIVGAAEANCTRHRFRWRRGAALVDSTMMISLFVVPALLRIGGETSLVLADELIREWNNIHPESPVRKGTYEELCDGFKWKIELPF